MVESAPALTIGLPVYNGARYLEKAVESIVGQSYADFELIISDNDSTDDTESIAREFVRRDPRVTYRRNPENVGLSANFNLVVPLARGRFFKWAAADDELRPTLVERCIEVLLADPGVVLAYPRTEFIDGEGRVLGLSDPGWHLVSDDPSKRLEAAILAGDFANSILGIIRTDALRQTRLLPRYAGADFRLLAELSLLGKIVEVAEPLYLRRIHEASSKGNSQDRGWLRRYMSGAQRGLGAAYWRLSRDRVAIVIRAPIQRRRKVAILVELARLLRYNWRRLAAEFREIFAKS